MAKANLRLGSIQTSLMNIYMSTQIQCDGFLAVNVHFVFIILRSFYVSEYHSIRLGEYEERFIMLFVFAKQYKKVRLFSLKICELKH